MQAVCAKCSRQMCRAVVLFLVAECAQTTLMIAPLPGDPNFSIDGSVAFFKSGKSNPTQPNPPPPPAPPSLPPPPPPGAPRTTNGAAGLAARRSQASPWAAARNGAPGRVGPPLAWSWEVEPH